MKLKSKAVARNVYSSLMETAMLEFEKGLNPADYPFTYARLRSPLLWLIPVAVPVFFALLFLGTYLEGRVGTLMYVLSLVPPMIFGVIGSFFYLGHAVYKDDVKLTEIRDAKVFDDLKESLLRQPVRSWEVKRELLKDEKGKVFYLYCEDESGRRFTEIMAPVDGRHFGRLDARATAEGWGAPRESEAKA
jgi:hypothetical protein